MKTKYLKTIGIKTNQPVGRGFLFPYDVTFDSSGVIYALNRGRISQGLGTRIQIFDYDEEWYGEFGEGSGTGPLNFLIPVATAFNSKDELFVSDEGSGEIKVFSQKGIPLYQVGGESARGSCELMGPSGIAFDADDNLYVTERSASRLTKIDRDGNVIYRVGDPGSLPLQFNMPWGVATDVAGCVYVADWRNDRIQKLDPDGNFIKIFGKSGTEQGHFNRPSSVAGDGRGNMYVTDWGNERVQVLDPEGNFLQILEGQATLSKWAEQWLTVNPDEYSARRSSNLSVLDLPDHLQSPYQVGSQTEHLFWGPVSAKIDDHERLYITEHSRARIQVFDISDNGL